ncbi:MAG: hypothetical protein J7L71_04395 [Spirochaetaceae bacterium]|nr:hypothetical protein [Spirochaetaceae bacterium]
MDNFYRIVLLIFLVSTRAETQNLEYLSRPFLSGISTSGSITIIPFDSWSSGSFNQLMSVINPFSPGKIQKFEDIVMDSTATTIYEGDLWVKKIGLSMGIRVDIDNNFIGKINRFLGYIGYHKYSVRVQTSRLKGTLNWNPVYAIPGMLNTAYFDTSFLTVDLLYYPRNQGSQFYYGIGYSSYQLPVLLESLILDVNKNIIYGNDVYQPDMKFSIYSCLFGFDSFQSAFMEIKSLINTGDGFAPWIATQDRFGGGLSVISSEAQTWIENANPGRYLYDKNQITMMVDYNLTIGARWIGNIGLVRLGMGLGYTIGGQAITAVSSKLGPITRLDQVDASPDLFLFHHGVIFKLSTSW